MMDEEYYRSRSTWQSVWVLLRLRLAIFTSGFRRSNLRGRIKYVILALVVSILVGGALYLSVKVYVFLSSPQFIAIIQQQEEFQSLLELLSSLPVVITTGIFFLLLLTSFGVMLQTLYLSKDLDFLLSLPIPTRAIFLAKLIQAILPNLGIVYLFSLPVMFILGFIWKFHLLYYIIIILLLAALAFAAGGLASLLVMLVVRIIPARRIAEVLGFLGAIFSIICSQSGQLARFSDLPGDQAEDLLDMASRINLPWSPLSWAGRGLVALGNQEWLLATGLLSTVFIGTILIFYLSLTLAEKLYYTGWASLQGVNSAKKTRKTRVTGTSKENTSSYKPAKLFKRFYDRILPSAIQGIVVKDSLVLRRDLRNLSQLVTPLIFGLIYTLLLFRGGGNPFAGSGNAPAEIQPWLQSLAVFGNVFISLFVSWTLLSRLAGMGFSQEGKNYWLIKSAPVSTTQQILGKFLVAYLPTLALSSLFLVIVSVMRAGSLRLLPYTLPAIAMIIAGNCGLNLAFGIAGTRMDWEDPRQMQRFLPGCLSSLATLVYLPVSLVFFLGPVVVATMLNFSEGLGWLIGMLLGGIITLVVAVVPLYVVKTRIDFFGEVH
jgi:ABC-2 type transport system permease protein